MSESATTVSRLEKTNTFCKFHQKEKNSFYCKYDETYICCICVPAHQSHQLIVLKDKCMELIKPWMHMKNQFTRLKNILLANKDKLPEDRYDKLIERGEKFNIKYARILKFKEQMQFTQLEQILNVEFERYKDKVYLFAKRLTEEYLPKINFSKKGPVKEPTQKLHPILKQLPDSSYKRKLKNNKNKDTKTKVKVLIPEIVSISDDEDNNDKTYHFEEDCSDNSQLLKQAIKNLEGKNEELKQLQDKQIYQNSSLNNRLEKLEQIIVQMHKEQVKLREQNELLLKLLNQNRRVNKEFRKELQKQQRNQSQSESSEDKKGSKQSHEESLESISSIYSNEHCKKQQKFIAYSSDDSSE